MVVGRLHRVDPQVVAHLEVAAYLLAGEEHDVDLVLVFVEVEHIAHEDISLTNDGVEGERCVERYVCPRNLQLQVVDQVAEGAVAKIAIAHIDGSFETSDTAVDIVVHAVDVCLEKLHVRFVDRHVCHTDELTRHLFVDHLSVFHLQLYVGIADVVGIA